ALSIKSTNPILEGIKIKAEGDFLTLTATDTELTIIKKIKADVLMEGETVVVGKYFVEFSKKLEKEQVELSNLSGEKLEIKYSDSVSELQIFSSENFPKTEINENGNYFALTQNEFKKMVEKTVFSCSIDDSRPILKGCLFEIKDSLLTVVALDGFRMSVVKKNIETNGDFSIVIPARTLQEITRLLEKDDEQLKVILNNNTLMVEVENSILISRLIEGEFVKYNHILPSSFENIVTVNKNQLLSSIERASIVAKNDRYNIIKFDVKEETMSISAKSEIGNVNENVNINLTGKDITIAFNGKYIMEFLKIVDSEFVSLNFNSPIDPCILQPMGDEEFLYLVLPVRISG
ncbi:MAG: DNA polymerase III subunit beta, partial [Firmicutes bacterium]|nr:DNA polymerase III subunit beta [Candidatus Caballimonas caccae]